MSNHFLGPFVGMDELPSSSAVEEVHVHLSHFSEPSKSISVHGYVSAKSWLSVTYWLNEHKGCDKVINIAAKSMPKS